MALSHGLVTLWLLLVLSPSHCSPYGCVSIPELISTDSGGNPDPSQGPPFGPDPSIEIFGDHLALSALTQASESGSKVVARVGDMVIMESELEKILIKEISEAEDRLYRLKYNTLQRLIDRKLLEIAAGERGLSPEELDRHFRDQTVSSDEIVNYYEENFLRFSRMDELKAKESIRSHLLNQKRQNSLSNVLMDLRKRIPVEINLVLPPGRLVGPVESGRPLFGNASAKVQINLFADIGCPYCANMMKKLYRLNKEHPDEISLTFTHMPSANHAGAFDAAEASECAREQGVFAPYLERIFTVETLNRQQLVALAEDLQMDTDRFKSCLSSHRHRNIVIDDVQTANKAGMRQTPTLIINNRLYEGDMPYEQLQRIIEVELAKPQSR